LLDFDIAIKLDPQFAGALVDRGAVYRLNGDLDRSLADLDEATSHAVIRTKPSRRAALYYTIGQNDYAKGGAEEAYQDRVNSKNKTITANCLLKEWTGLRSLQGSLHYRFLGPFESVDRRQFADNGGVDAKWAILDIEHNMLVGDCGACSYAEIHDWYQKLCPSTAPSEW
jgi:hypothetical protein